MSASPSVRLDTLRLLVVEDDEFAVRVYRRTLLRYGISIQHAVTAAAALEALASDPNFDAMILDLSLPGGIGGAELLAELDRQNIELPVIVITASDDLKSARELMPYIRDDDRRVVLSGELDRFRGSAGGDDGKPEPAQLTRND